MKIFQSGSKWHVSHPEDPQGTRYTFSSIVEAKNFCHNYERNFSDLFLLKGR